MYFAAVMVYLSCLRLVTQPTVILRKHGSMDYMHERITCVCVYICIMYFFNMIYWACSSTLVVLHAFSPLFTLISYNQIVKVY